MTHSKIRKERFFFLSLSPPKAPKETDAFIEIISLFDKCIIGLYLSMLDAKRHHEHSWSLTSGHANNKTTTDENSTRIAIIKNLFMGIG